MFLVAPMPRALTSVRLLVETTVDLHSFGKRLHLKSWWPHGADAKTLNPCADELQIKASLVAIRAANGDTPQLQKLARRIALKLDIDCASDGTVTEAYGDGDTSGETDVMQHFIEAVEAAIDANQDFAAGLFRSYMERGFVDGFAKTRSGDLHLQVNAVDYRVYQVETVTRFDTH